MPTGWLEWLVFVGALAFGWITLVLVILAMPARMFRSMRERLAARRLWREAARYLSEQEEEIRG